MLERERDFNKIVNSYLPAGIGGERKGEKRRAKDRRGKGRRTEHRRGNDRKEKE